MWKQKTAPRHTCLRAESYYAPTQLVAPSAVSIADAMNSMMNCVLFYNYTLTVCRNSWGRFAATRRKFSWRTWKIVFSRVAQQSLFVLTMQRFDILITFY
jgi:hypothetical protein